MKFTTQDSEQASQLDLRPIAGRGETSMSREALQSWKEIAVELGRGVRTVQRWERTLQLPIHRLGKGPRSPVFAFKEEIRVWMRTRAADDPTEDQRQNDSGTERRRAEAARFTDGSGLFAKTMPAHESRPGIRSEVQVRIAKAVSGGLFKVPPPTEQLCAECNSPVQPLDGEFRFYASTKRWKVSLPFCPACDLGVLRSVRPLRQVH